MVSYVVDEWGNGMRWRYVCTHPHEYHIAISDNRIFALERISMPRRGLLFRDLTPPYGDVDGLAL